MNRALLLAAAGLLATGCGSSTYRAPFEDVVVYWDFSRSVVGAAAVPYDANLNPGGSGRCAQSAVDYVVVTDQNGVLIDPSTPTIPCIYSGVQGVTFSNFEAGFTYSFLVTGYRNGVSQPLFQGQNSIAVVAGADNRLTVDAAGIPGDLDLFAYLYSTQTIPPTPYTSCSQATIDLLTYSLYDHLGTLIATGNNVGCNGATPVAFFVGTVDRDSYTVRVNGYNPSNTLLFDSCSTPFDHFASQTGAGGVAVALDNPVPTCP